MLFFDDDVTGVSVDMTLAEAALQTYEVTTNLVAILGSVATYLVGDTALTYGIDAG
jgi:hypothetical protein